MRPIARRCRGRRCARRDRPRHVARAARGAARRARAGAARRARPARGHVHRLERAGRDRRPAEARAGARRALRGRRRRVARRPADPRPLRAGQGARHRRRPRRAAGRVDAQAPALPSPPAAMSAATTSPSTGRRRRSGRRRTWPRSLSSIVQVLLSSRFSMWMAWGPDLTFFCNDAYRRDTLGKKYPWALGRPAREVWAEIWPDIGPRIETVLRTGAGDLGRGAAAVPRAQRRPRGDLPHVLLQPAGRRRRADRGDAVRRQRGHRPRDRRTPAGDAARPRRGDRRRPHRGRAAGRGARAPRRATRCRCRSRSSTSTTTTAARGWRRPAGSPPERRVADADDSVLVEIFPTLPGERPPRAGARAPARPAARLPRRRAHARPAARRGLPRLPRPGRRPDRRRSHHRARLRGGAPPRRDAARARPGQDRVLHQRQP